MRCALVLAALVLVLALVAGDEGDTHALLDRLGLQRLHVPAAHHRKRLAEQARRHAAGDSRMFVIKLPPSHSYYSHARPGSAALAAPLPLALRSNGRPAGVYHWNLPALRRLAAARLDDVRPHPNSVHSPAYYTPAERDKSFRKYFAGNGKPKSFYVIDKNKKPVRYHNLFP